MNRKRLYMLILAVLLFSSCRTINRSREELGIPQSVVIFSFDDGPNSHADTTARLLDVLKKYEVHAMFALLGVNAEHNPDLVRRIADEGHYIINHGYSDKWACKMGPDEFRNNLIKGETAITEVLGQETLSPKRYRPHGGFYRSKHGSADGSARRSGQDVICREEGYTMVLSSVRVYDAVLTGAERGKVVKRLLRKVEQQDGGIILLHDARNSYFSMEKKLAKDPYGICDRSWIPDTVEEIIIALRERGFAIGGPDGDAILSLNNF